MSADIEKSHIKRFAEAIGDTNPLWNDERAARKTCYGGMIAPPTFLRIIPFGRPDNSLDLPGSHKVDGGSEWEYFEPVRPGDRITGNRKVVELYERQGQRGPVIFIVTHTIYTNQFGDTVASQKTTSIRSEGGSGSGGVAKHPDKSPEAAVQPESKERLPHRPVFWDEVEEGGDTPPLAKRATISDLARYAGASGDFNPLHLDRDAAQQAGLPDVIIHGALKNAWLGQLVTDWLCYEGRLHKLAVQYRGVDLASMFLTCRGRVVRKHVKNGLRCVDLDIWIENEGGRQTTLGGATVSLPNR